MYRVVVLASAGGGNFESVVNGQEVYGYTVTKLIVDRVCGAIDKAEKFGIECVRVEKEDADGRAMSEQLLRSIPEDTDLIVMCGWLSILKKDFLEHWTNKIINTHPSLLPKYGGKGMYGTKVHEAVMANHEKYTGCTIHYVTEGIDAGEIILQKQLEVDYTLTPWELGGKVFALENKAVVEAIVKLMGNMPEQ